MPSISLATLGSHLGAMTPYVKERITTNVSTRGYFYGPDERTKINWPQDDPDGALREYDRLVSRSHRASEDMRKAALFIKSEQGKEILDKTPGLTKRELWLAANKQIRDDTKAKGLEDQPEGMYDVGVENWVPGGKSKIPWTLIMIAGGGIMAFMALKG